MHLKHLTDLPTGHLFCVAWHDLISSVLQQQQLIFHQAPQFLYLYLLMITYLILLPLQTRRKDFYRDTNNVLMSCRADLKRLGLKLSGELQTWVLGYHAQVEQTLNLIFFTDYKAKIGSDFCFRPLTDRTESLFILNDKFFPIHLTGKVNQCYFKRDILTFFFTSQLTSWLKLQTFSLKGIFFCKFIKLKLYYTCDENVFGCSVNA